MNIYRLLLSVFVMDCLFLSPILARELDEVDDEKTQENQTGATSELYETSRQKKLACESIQKVNKRHVSDLTKSKKYGEDFKKFMAEKEALGPNCPSEDQIVAEFFARHFGIERFSSIDNNPEAKNLKSALNKGYEKSYSMQTIIDQALKDELVYVIAETNKKKLNEDLNQLPKIRSALQEAENELSASQKNNDQLVIRSENLLKADILIERAQNSLMTLMKTVFQAELYKSSASIKHLGKNIPLGPTQKSDEYIAMMKDFSLAAESALASSAFIAIQGLGFQNEVAKLMEKQIKEGIKNQLKARKEASYTNRVQNPLNQDEADKVADDFLKNWIDSSTGQFDRKKVISLLKVGVDKAEEGNKKEMTRLDKILDQIKKGIINSEKQDFYNEVASTDPKLIDDILLGVGKRESSDFQSLLQAYCLLQTAAPLAQADKTLTTLYVGIGTAAFGPVASAAIGAAATVGVAEGVAMARVVRLGGILMSAHGAYQSGKTYLEAHDGCKSMAEAFDKKMISDGINENTDSKVIEEYAQEHLLAYGECQSMANTQQALSIVSGAAAMTGGVSALRASNKVLGVSTLSKAAHVINLGASGIESGVAMKHMFEVCKSEGWDSNSCKEAKLALTSAIANTAYSAVGNRGPTAKEAFHMLKYVVKSPTILANANLSGLIHETINVMGGKKLDSPIVSREKLADYLARREFALEDNKDMSLTGKIDEKKFLALYDAENELKMLGSEFVNAKKQLLANKELKAKNVEEAAITIAIARAESGKLKSQEALELGNSIAKTLVDMKRKGELSLKGVEKNQPGEFEALSKASGPLLSNTLKALDPRVWSIVKENFNGQIAEAIQIYYLLKTTKNYSPESIKNLFMGLGSDCFGKNTSIMNPSSSGERRIANGTFSCQGGV